MFNKKILLVFIAIAILHTSCSLLEKKEVYDTIVLITIDTLRADHLHSYGYPRKTTPFIDSLANKGVLFKNAFVPMPTTKPSHASIFTSKYPIQHKVLNNATMIDGKFKTFAEILNARGYYTAAFPSVEFKYTGLNKGFEYFDETSVLDPGLKPFAQTHLYREAEYTANKTINWLKENKKHKKLFLWIHFFDPHSPYYTIDSNYKKFYNQCESRFVDYLLNKQKIDYRFHRKSKRILCDRISKYDAEIAYVDTNVKRIYKQLDKLGLNKHALWIITSDHGEGLGNHMFGWHSIEIYNEQLKVPLIFHSTDKSIKPNSIDNVVENIDILPTTLDLLHHGIWSFNFAGKNLAPVLRGNTSMLDRSYAFSQRVKNPPGLMTLYRYTPGDRYSLQDGHYKYVWRTDGKDEFYNLKHDPYELKNLINVKSSVKDRLIIKLQNKIKELKSEK